MELREYLRIVLKNWWLILPMMMLAATATLFFSYRQKPVYEATSSFVTTLENKGGDVDSTIYALDTLTGRERIPVTYCSIMTSGAVREEAFRLMAIDPTQVDMTKYTVTCANLPQTNVLFLAVQGYSPNLVMRFAEAIGEAGMARANALYGFFPLRPLDAPFMEPKPISPKIPQNAVLGTAFGLVAGIMGAFMLEYLRSPMEKLEGAAIRNMQLGIYNERYFRERFEQEARRAQFRHRPMTVAMISIEPTEAFELLNEPIQVKLLRSLVLNIEDAISQGDLLAYLRPRTLVALLPETTGDEAQANFESLYEKIRTQIYSADGFAATFYIRVGIISGNDGAGYKATLERAQDALENAQEKGRAVYLVRSEPRPFLLGDEEEARAESYDKLRTSELLALGLSADSISVPNAGGNGHYDKDETQNVVMRPLSSDSLEAVLPSETYSPDDPTLPVRPPEFQRTEGEAPFNIASRRGFSTLRRSVWQQMNESNSPDNTSDEAKG
jgi:capsular polysaccharide biosynthesis protein